MPRDESRLGEGHGARGCPADSIDRAAEQEMRGARTAPVTTSIDGPHLPITGRAPRNGGRDDEAADVVDDCLWRGPLNAIAATCHVNDVGFMPRFATLTPNLDDLSIVQSQLVRGGVVRELRIREVPSARCRERIRDA